MRPPAIVIHSLAEADAALAAAEAAGRAVTLISAPGAAGYAGPGFFAALIETAAERHPGARFEAVLDCATAAGDALGALRRGLKLICFVGDREVADKLAEIAASLDAAIVTDRPAALDPRGARDKVAACRAWIEGRVDG